MLVPVRSPGGGWLEGREAMMTAETEMAVTVITEVLQTKIESPEWCDIRGFR
ncbi:MAG: hypothetical protein HOE75_14510 [Chloroflexi bacterium]|nr:hypothetical protein [Chloroflexota bacterium]MBT4074884.1 hypothetical protein [Chloroflexota bacterium]